MEQIALSEIEHVLDEKVRPQLAEHDGNIRVEKLEDGVLHVRMVGNCSNCPSAELTMENTVDTALTEAFPDLKQVVLVTGVSDELIEDMREILAKRHSS